MHRIDTSTAQKDKFGRGKNGFTRGNPQTGTPATQLDYSYCDAIQEEIANVIESAGTKLDKSRHDQLYFSIQKLIDAGVIGNYLPASTTGDDKFNVCVETNFRKRPKFDNSSLIALNDFESRHSTNGYQKLPSGLIIQWCSGVTNSSGALSLTLPIAFPHRLFNVVVAEANAAAWDPRAVYSYGYTAQHSTLSTIAITSRVIVNNSVSGASGKFSIIAIGN